MALKKMFPCLFSQRMPQFTIIKNNDIANEESTNSFNLQVLDSILEDNEDNFIQLIQDTNMNKTFKITNYSTPDFLHDNPTYLSLCCCFSAEKCFSAMSLLSPSGLNSPDMQKVDDYNRSPIHFACIGGSLNIIRELEQSNFDLNVKDASGYYPSHYAAFSGHCDVIKYLWTKGASITMPSSIPLTIKPFEISCLYGYIEIVKFFCESVHPKEGEKNSHFSIGFFSNLSTPLHYACIGGHADIVKYFLKNDVDVKYQINALDFNSCNPLLCACQNGSIECVKALLENGREKINLNMKCRKHLPLVDAEEGGHLDIVQLLLKQKGIQIDQETSQKIYPLYAAVINNHYQVAKYLVQNGAAKSFDKNKIGKLMLAAIGTDNFEIVDLIDKNFDVPYYDLFTVVKFGSKYIGKACALGNREIISLLLDKEVKIDYFDIFCIISEKNFPLLDFLIDKGIKMSDYDKMFKPLIVHIIEYGDFEKVKHFISRGIVLNKEIIEKHSCLSIVSKKCDLDFFNFILSFEPDLTDDDFKEALNETLFCFFRYQENFNKIMQIVEIILNKVKIDFNDFIKNSSETYITFASNMHNTKLLELYEKYGADFENCSLEFANMVDESYIPVYNFLKEHGCKFEKAIVNDNFGTPKMSDNPLGVLLKRIIRNNNLKIDTLLFILDYSTPKNIKKSKYRNNNVIDVLVNHNCFDGILKAFKLVKSVFYPLSISKKEFERKVLNSFNIELSNFMFK